MKTEIKKYIKAGIVLSILIATSIAIVPATVSAKDLPGISVKVIPAREGVLVILRQGDTTIGAQFTDENGATVFLREDYNLQPGYYTIHAIDGHERIVRVSFYYDGDLAHLEISFDNAPYLITSQSIPISSQISKN